MTAHTPSRQGRQHLEQEHSNALFQRVLKADRAHHIEDDYLTRWLFVDRLYARGQRKEMSFYDYLGPIHVDRFMRWIQNTPYPDWLGPRATDLAEISVKRDLDCLEELGVERAPGLKLEQIARYNAQDYLLQRAYETPDRMKPRTILDFGAGHGRQANLAFSDEDHVTETMIAIDGIPGSYLTQRAYYEGLELRSADYLDYAGSGRMFDVEALAADHDVVHLPTWRFDLVPDDCVDLAIAVQVFKELPRQLVIYVLKELGRVVKPGGALYVRDHLQNHNPNHMPIDQLLLANGFVLEHAPQVRDRHEIHGLPRIWRKIDPSLYFDPDADI